MTDPWLKPMGISFATSGAHTMNIDAKAREIVTSDEWDIELLLTTNQSRSLTKAIAAALLSARNGAIEDVITATIAKGYVGQDYAEDFATAIRALKGDA